MKRVVILLLAGALLADPSRDLKMSITIAGTFSEAEAKSIIDAMRAIERKHPERTYIAFVDAPNSDAGLMKRMVPPEKGHERHTWELKRK